jgi:hypothetical protein
VYNKARLSTVANEGCLYLLIKAELKVCCEEVGGTLPEAWSGVIPRSIGAGNFLEQGNELLGA